MRYLLLLPFLFLATFLSNGQENEILKLYVGTYTSEGSEGIYLCNFNSESGGISLDKIFKGVDNPSFLKVSADKKYLYSVSRTTPEIEKSGGFVVAYKIGKNGFLHFLNKQISNGAGPCHVDVSGDGKYAAIATYGGGTTSLYPINSNGSLQPASSIVDNNKAQNENDKVVSHAHSIKFSPFDEKIYSADLGTDQLNIFFNNNGELIWDKQKFVKLEKGAGPRHFEFHKNGNTIYV
ncbi:MAG: lactonase family protein, partial [Draconibacterium sp.]|nr:lactonase family protein [Draconibacterium sp.]